MDRRVGQFLHKDGWMGQKRFSGDGTSTRTFTVLIAAAEDAGIIGPENNGIVVLDDDNGQVVLDQHLREETGYFGPSKRQQDEFKRVMAMDWAAFSEFCRTNRRFRKRSAPDITAGSEPAYVEEDGLREAIRTGRASETGTDIRTADMKAFDDPTVKAGGLSFPCRTREQMIVHLVNHHLHTVNYHGPSAIAWDIKVGNFDASGHLQFGEKTDPHFDQRWQEYLKENGNEVFAAACEDALRSYLDGEFTTFAGDDQGAFKFSVVGRQGGHLILQSWNGPQARRGHYPMSFDSQNDLIDYLRDLSPEDLCRLYKVVATVDHNVNNRASVMTFHYNFRRATLEEQWAAELEKTNSPSP